jgi:phospholipid/cholesterol/gamma-HCH transport system permease protein
MQTSSSSIAIRMQQLIVRFFSRIWHTIAFTAEAGAYAFTRSTYRGDNRVAIARQIVTDSTQNIIWFTVLCALLSTVLIRIVVVTAVSYGLSRYALEMVVRVLVLELIPLTAAIFVALRSTLPDGVELVEQRARGHWKRMREAGIDPIQREALPRLLAGLVLVPMLVAVSCVTASLIAYITIYGFSPWGFEAYTRVVGQIFTPTISLVLVLKTFFFSLAVSITPIAAAFSEDADMTQRGRTKAARELAAMVRLFTVILLIEVVSLVGNYY